MKRQNQWKKRKRVLTAGVILTFFLGIFLTAKLEMQADRKGWEKSASSLENNIQKDGAVDENESSYSEKELLEKLATQENGGSFDDVSADNTPLEDRTENILDTAEAMTEVEAGAGAGTVEEGFPDYLYGDSYMEQMEQETHSIGENQQLIQSLKKKHSLSYLLKHFYILNPTTTIDEKIFNVDQLLSKDCTIKKKEEPQILILHTHGASEYFSDSREGNEEDSVIGVGDELTRILEEEYGYQVIHDRTPYDLIDGEIDRNQAYTIVDQKVPELLEEYPGIEVVIDLHRDASSDGKTKRVTTIDGKDVAKVMFFNGLSRNLDGDIEYLYNPNLQGNLAFSLQMKLKSMEYYDDFTLPIFLKGYRYSLHMKEKSLLIELGNEVNTVEEAKNAMEPLAKILDAVLMGK